MDLKDILERSSPLTISGFQELQGAYDKEFVDKKFDNSFDKVRHTYAHMGKLMGRLADYIEAMEEGRTFSPEDIKKKVIPDLHIYSAWLAEEFDVNIEQALITRFVGNLIRLHSDALSSQEIGELQGYVDKKFNINPTETS